MNKNNQGNKAKKCQWKQNHYDNLWNTDCDEKHMTQTGGPKHNRFRYCPFCGREIQEIKRK